jgi:hypothetical protein
MYRPPPTSITVPVTTATLLVSSDSIIRWLPSISAGRQI